METWISFMNQYIPIIATTLIAVVGGMLGLWWRVEAKQDRAITRLRETNDEAHNKLRKDMTEQHGQLRDKIERIWQHMVKHG
jgi:uncharacterized membrane protein YfbV (UPF0208 family)